MTNNLWEPVNTCDYYYNYSRSLLLLIDYKYINSKATNHTFVLLVACFLKGLLLNQVMLAQSQQLYVLMN